jgi:hypothetical protein
MVVPKNMRKIIMSETEKQQLLRENRELKKKLNLEIEDIPSYSFSQITLLELRSLVEIKLKLNEAKFDDWFNHSNITLDNTDISFLENLINKHAFSIATYQEETLKVKFISPILNRIEFSDLEKEIGDFYDESLTYKTEKFILTGKVDFMVSKGYFYSETPYFFIQEFKPSTTAKNPQPQLLAELIAAVELNQFTTLKGAFIIGALWHFVILEKIGIDSYQYFISKSYDSTDLEKLQGIYKNLLYVKQEIFALQDN